MYTIIKLFLYNLLFLSLSPAWDKQSQSVNFADALTGIHLPFVQSSQSAVIRWYQLAEKMPANIKKNEEVSQGYIY